MILEGIWDLNLIIYIIYLKIESKSSSSSLSYKDSSYFQLVSQIPNYQILQKLSDINSN